LHSYSIDTDERSRVIAILAIISVGISSVISPIFEKLESMSLFHIFKILNIHLSTPSSMALFWVLYKIFDLYLWKVKIIRKIFKIETPILHGKWKGKYYSKRRCEKTNKLITKEGDVELHIIQTWTKIRITQESSTSYSYSEMAGITTNDRMGITLRYQYRNESKAIGEETMHSHTGFNKLRYLPENKRLEGDYFTDKDRRTYGTLWYEKVSQKSKTPTKMH